MPFLRSPRTRRAAVVAVVLVLAAAFLAGGAAALPPAPVITPNTTPQVGQLLTDTSGNTGVLFQWLRCDTATPANCAPIAGAITASYTVTTDDVGHKLAVSELAGGGGTAQSALTPTVTLAPPTLTAAPTIAGAPVLGQTLTETHGSWTASPTGYGVQWVDCDGAGNACTPIPNATGQTYGLVAADIGHTIRVFEVAVNAGGTSVPVASGPTGVVAAPPVSTAAPTVSGKAVVGGTLGCTTGAWTGTQPLAYSYMWFGDGVPIAGATGNTHKLAATDVAQAVGCEVTATNVAGSATSRSNTVLVTAAPACFGLAGASLGECKARNAERSALGKCSAISTRTKSGRTRKAACVAKAKLTYKRAVATAKCQSIKSSSKRAACVARAKRIKK
jgi:hypothetical protein